MSDPPYRQQVLLRPDAPSALARGSMRPWQPWTTLALFSFLLHFVWEMLAIAFYTGMLEMAHGDGVRSCLLATIGDVVITLVAYAVVALRTERAWLTRPTRGAILGYLGIGLGITVIVEYGSVYQLARWTYAPAMPVVAGVGVWPLLQWIVLPLLTLWLTRRHLAPVSSLLPRLKAAS